MVVAQWKARQSRERTEPSTADSLSAPLALEALGTRAPTTRVGHPALILSALRAKSNDFPSAMISGWGQVICSPPPQERSVVSTMRLKKGMTGHPRSTPQEQPIRRARERKVGISKESCYRNGSIHVGQGSQCIPRLNDRPNLLPQSAPRSSACPACSTRTE